MPVMDGRELLANVRARNFRVPVIVVTGSEADIRDAVVTTAYGVIAKPADPERLIATVNAAIGHRTSHTPLAKIWLAAASLPRSGGQRPTVLSRSWWSTRRRRVGVVCFIVGALVVFVIVAARPRARPGR